MTDDCRYAGQGGQSTEERLIKLCQAREQMAAALWLLDQHSRSPAAATLDLAIHHLDTELAG